MTYCLLRIAKAQSLNEWGGMVYAEDEVLGGIGPFLSLNEVETAARALWPEIEVEPADGLRPDGERLTGIANLDLDCVDPGSDTGKR